MIGIVSDIHGNYPALQAVLQELDKLGCDFIISLGDVSGYYCMINECIEELRNREIPNIMGNHDYYIVNHSKCGRSYTANLCIEYQRSVMKEENIEWLAKSLLDWKKDGIWMVHGGWKDPIDEYITDFSFLNEKKDEIRLYISGHTHVQREECGKYARYYNPGSVGQPRDYNPDAAFAIVEDGNVYLKRVKYDINRIAYEMDRVGFPERVYSCLYHGMKIGEDGK